MISLNPEKTGFVDESGARWVPFGVNYYDHLTGWAPQIWSDFHPERVREHFRLMREYGVNCARVFMASNRFMLPDGHLDPAIRPKFEFYLECARETGIRLIPTGPDHWEGRHEAFEPDPFCGEPYLSALRNFWPDMIAAYGDRDEIFAWDLRNEPEVHWDTAPMRAGWQRFLRARYGCQKQLAAAWGEELRGETLGEISVPADVPDEDNPRLYDYQLFREQIAYDWTKTQTDAMRAAGCRQLITIGYIQWSFPLTLKGDLPSGYAAFNPRKLSGLLDFDCAHFDPVLDGDPLAPARHKATLEYARDWVCYCDLSRPVVLEEYGYYGGGSIPDGVHAYRPQEDLYSYSKSLVEFTSTIADGWLSWPFIDTPSSLDISRFGGLVTKDLRPKLWGEAFRELAAASPRFRHGEKRVPFVPTEDEMRAYLTGCEGKKRYDTK